MKKIVVILCLTFLLHFLHTAEENLPTVLELQIEKEYSAWLQEIITPYVGKNLVLVDVTLQYPQTGPDTLTKELDENITLPGFPVAKTSDDSKLDEASKSKSARLLSQKISIFLSDKISQQELNNLQQKIEQWLNLDYTRGDALSFKQDPVYRSISYYPYYIIAALILLLILINVRTGFNYLGKALKKVNITGMDNVIKIKGTLDNFSNSQYANDTSTPNELNFAPDSPVPVKLIRESKKAEEDQINFHFLENLSPENFDIILSDEIPEVQAYVISQLKNEYIQNYLDNFPERAKKVLDSLLAEGTLKKAQILDAMQRIKRKFIDIKELATFSYDSKDILVKVLNALPIQDAVDMIADLKKQNPVVIEKIRNKILLPEDVLTLDPDFIKMLIRTVDKNILIPYIASQSEEIKTFFFKHMTDRSVAIFKDEIASLRKMSESDEKAAVSSMINKIREILFHKTR